MEELKNLLEESLNEGLYQMAAGGSRNKDAGSRVKVRPVLIGGKLLFQIETYRGNQVFHKNMPKEEAVREICQTMEGFRQLDVENVSFSAVVLVSKKGKVTIRKKEKRQSVDPAAGQKAGRAASADRLAHNRRKQYILEEGRVVPFLVDLGVQTPEGKVVRSRYDKFRQINRFLEFIADVRPNFPTDRCVRIIDFGCGKSYLTFAMYYYLHELCGLDIRITGLDLKADVIHNCNALAVKYGYEGLSFQEGDIAVYEGTDAADMVVTLHACDTATDYALYKAIGWNAKVILSVPCCQHEVNGQIKNEVLWPALKYGLIKERMSALLTDAIRANLLEEAGYDTQILEFIDMEHTPKNILIRAVKRERPGERDTHVSEMAEALGAHTCLQELMKGMHPQEAKVIGQEHS